MSAQATQLIALKNATVEHLFNGVVTPIAKGTVALTSLSFPLSSPPSYSAAQSSKSNAPPPLPPRQEHDTWLVLTLHEDGASPDSEPMYELPIPATARIVTLPPRAYVIPAPLSSYEAYNASSTGGATTSKKPTQEDEAGFIKVTLPTDVDSYERELFEATLWGMASFSSPGASSLVDPSAHAPDHDLRSKLVLVDEDNGSVLGSLDQDIVISEDPSLGREHQGENEKEPVVIELQEGTTAAPSGLVTVRPISKWQEAPNPTNSKMISGANFLSRGIVLGAEAISRGMEYGSDKFVAHTKPSEKPLVFAPRTHSTTESTHKFTSTAVQISGKTVAVIGEIATGLGDKVGKTLGIQTTPSGKPPKGIRGVVNRGLLAFNTVFDSLEHGGKTLLESGGASASQAVGHRYGQEAQNVSDRIGGSVKHVALVYIDARGVTRKALLRSVGKSALRAKIKDGREVVLTEENARIEYAPVGSDAVQPKGKAKQQ